jgi:cytidine deaminase
MQSKLARLLESATPLVGELKLDSLGERSAATVAAALLAKSGRIYTGVCVHLSSGIGFCAEHAAVAEMLKARETEIEMIVAVWSGGILAPCGRCRELLAQVNPANFSCHIALPGGSLTTLRELLPNHWTDGRVSE